MKQNLHILSIYFSEAQNIGGQNCLLVQGPDPGYFVPLKSGNDYQTTLQPLLL